jgi:hypothetical protein
MPFHAMTCHALYFHSNAMAWHDMARNAMACHGKARHEMERKDIQWHAMEMVMEMKMVME